MKIYSSRNKYEDETGVAQGKSSQLAIASGRLIGFSPRKKSSRKKNSLLFKYMSMSTGIVRHFAKSVLTQSLKALVCNCLHLSSTFIRVSLELRGRYRVPTLTLVN